MFRLWLIVAGLVAAVTGSVQAQGISGVTRRTPMIQRQQPARQFFDAAGVRAAGGTGPSPSVAATPPTGRVVLPPISERLARSRVTLVRMPGTNLVMVPLQTVPATRTPATRYVHP